MSSHHSNNRLFIVVDADWFFLSHRLPIALKAMQEGYEVTVVATDTGQADCIRSYGIRFIGQQFLRKGIHPMREFRIVWLLYKLYKEEKPDIVHHIALKILMNGSVAARLAGVSQVVNAVAGLGHYFVSPWKRRLAIAVFSPFLWFSRTLPQMCYIFQNNEDQQEFQRHAWAKASQCFIIRGSGVDLQKFPFSESEEQSPLKILMGTRLLKDKGVFEFAEAARILKSRWGAQIEFVLAGKVLPINPSSISEETILQWEKDGILKWVGFQSDMLPLLRNSEIHVLPSYREGLPKSLIESCAVGRPIVTTDVPGCREVVRQGINGFLVPPRNAALLAEAIERLIPDRSLRLAMGHQSRKIAEQEFSIQLVVEKTMAIYHRLSHD